MSAAAPVHGNTRTRGRRGHREMTPSSIMLLLALTACLAGTVFCQVDEDTKTVEETQTENDAGFSVIPTVSDATPTPDSYLSSESPSEGYETEAESGSGFSPGVNSEGEDQLKSSEAPLEDSLSLTFILVPVVLVVVIIAMVVGVVIINRRWNRKEKSNCDHVEEDKYLHGSDDTENVPMPMFEDDVPSVLELEMEDLEQWMNKDGGVRMDSGQGI
ncbi:transmembrane protein 154-like [Salvelinus fontinalis]|uniref:transmembrane protein 154-like n=1 Tax=Salvelinus fontinalis TaxID=8038 RepID=UPI002484F5F7|nr:transmembrane protein 154-like [Salvelinus fontinalis]XP_055764951.1 transmembrane protein 154-like [Salvelinus fontinalis]